MMKTQLSTQGQRKFPIKFFILLLILSLTLVPSASAHDTNVSLNYVYNGTDWVGWNSTKDGKPRVDISLMNITSGNAVLSNNLTVDTNTLLVDATNDVVTIGTLSAGNYKLNVIGGINGTWVNATYLNATQWVNATALSVTGSTVFNSIRYTWPSADGSNNQLLTTNGAGTLSWTTVSASGWTLDNNKLYNSSSILVGIGTSTPASTLEVIGQINNTGLITNLPVIAINNSELIGYWPFDSNYRDYSNQTNDGVLYRPNISIDGLNPNGRHGGALYLSGNGSYVNAGNSSILNPRSRMTIEAWVKPALGSIASNETIASKWATASKRSFSLFRNADEQYHWMVSSDGTAFDGTVTSSAYADTNWHHVAATLDSTGLRLYIDGTFVGSDASPASIFT